MEKDKLREKIKELPEHLTVDDCLKLYEKEGIVGLVKTVSSIVKKQEKERMIKDIRSIAVESDSATIFLSKTLYYLKYIETLKGER